MSEKFTCRRAHDRMAEVLSKEISSTLAKCSVGELSTLSHSIATSIGTHQPLDYSAFAQLWSVAEWWAITDYITKLMTLSVKNTWTKDEVFVKLGLLPDDYKQTLLEALSVRREDIRQSLLTQTAAISENVLTDFDWQMKLVMSSDKLSAVHTPLLNLDLHVTDCNSQNKVVSLELDREDLKKLVASLEGAGKAVQQLSS